MAVEHVVEELRRENGALRQDCGSLRSRLGKMVAAREREREKEKEKEKERGRREGEGECGREVEEKMKELQQEKAARLLAEQKFLDAMNKLRAVGILIIIIEICWDSRKAAA